MDDKFKKQLQDNIFKQLELLYEGKDTGLSIAKIATSAVIIALDEYEKLKAE